MDVYSQVINEFLAAACSKSHTPGGGNVSAVVGTLGASMVAMVANLTLDKKGYEDFQADTKDILDQVMAGIEKLKDLTAKDMEAFDGYMKCFKLPKDDDDQKAARTQAIQDAAKKATLVPLTICETCADLMRQADRLSRFGNKMAISDVGVGAYVLEAALRACMLSVDINLPTIKDQAFVADVINRRARLFVIAEDLKIKALTYVKEKMG